MLPVTAGDSLDPLLGFASIVKIDVLNRDIASLAPTCARLRAMGIAVFSGMVGVTVFGLVLTPVFYVLLRKLTAKGRHAAQAAKGALHG